MAPDTIRFGNRLWTVTRTTLLSDGRAEAIDGAWPTEDHIDQPALVWLCEYGFAELLGGPRRSIDEAAIDDKGRLWVRRGASAGSPCVVLVPAAAAK